MYGQVKRGEVVDSSGDSPAPDQPDALMFQEAAALHVSSSRLLHGVNFKLHSFGWLTAQCESLKILLQPPSGRHDPHVTHM